MCSFYKEINNKIVDYFVGQYFETLLTGNFALLNPQAMYDSSQKLSPRGNCSLFSGCNCPCQALSPYEHLFILLELWHPILDHHSPCPFQHNAYYFLPTSWL